jgi:hypothetical protein
MTWKPMRRWKEYRSYITLISLNECASRLHRFFIVQTEMPSISTPIDRKSILPKNGIPYFCQLKMTWRNRKSLPRGSWSLPRKISRNEGYQNKNLFFHECETFLNSIRCSLSLCQMLTQFDDVISCSGFTLKNVA